MKKWYDTDEDILNIELEEGKEYWKSVEIGDGVVIDIATDGSITGIEILHARKVLNGDAKKVLGVVTVAV